MDIHWEDTDMERTLRGLAICAFSSGLLLAPCEEISADPTGFYVGAGAGYSKIDDLDALGGAKAILGPGDTFNGFTKKSKDDDDVGWKIYGGYRFHRFFAVEASYVDFGDFSVDTNGTATVSGFPTTFATSFDTDISGLGLAALAIWPAVGEQLSFFGKVGAFRWDADSDLRVPFAVGGLPGLFSDSDDDDGIELMFGLGAEYYFLDKFALRVEWERFNDLGDESTVRFEDDVDLFSGSLQYRF